MRFEISALNVNGTKKALQKHGLLTEVLARLTPEARAVFEAPYSAKWHDAKALLAVWQAVKELRGVEQVTALNHEIIRDSIGPVLTPVLKLATALSGATPATLLSRLDQLASAASRGSTHVWKAESPTRGTLRITYPAPEPLELIGPIWKGILRVTGDLIGKPAVIEQVTEEGGNTFVFVISW